MSRTAYRDRLCARTKQARENAGLSQSEMATALDIPTPRYVKYESRTPLPHHLIEQFCIIARIDPLWLLSGKRHPTTRRLARLAIEHL